MEGRIWGINHNGSADVHTPFTPSFKVVGVAHVAFHFSRGVRRTLPHF